MRQTAQTAPAAPAAPPPARRFSLSERLRRWQAQAEDHCFERWHRLALGGTTPHEALVSSHAQALPHATAYQGVWCCNLRTLLHQAQRLNPGLRHFVDLGSGKGKACFYAATRMPFERIVGVEFSEPLLAVAQHNRQRFGVAKIHFECADAGDWQLPEGDTLVFMFNPFDGVVLGRFLQRNREHFRRFGSLVAYANDVHRGTLREHGFDTVFRDPRRCISLFSAG